MMQHAALPLNLFQCNNIVILSDNQAVLQTLRNNAENINSLNHELACNIFEEINNKRLKVSFQYTLGAANPADNSSRPSPLKA